MSTFENSKINAFRSVQKAMNEWTEYDLVRKKQTNSKQNNEPEIVNPQPRIPYIKINTAISTEWHPQKTGMGIIAREERGKLRAVKTLNGRKLGCTSKAELEVIRFALIKAKEQG